MSYERVEKRMTYIYKFGSADLHTHTNASDGLFKPKELIRQAKRWLRLNSVMTMIRRIQSKAGFGVD